MLLESDFVKIRVAVPLKNADRLREVLAAAGAGGQGNYDNTSGSYKQIGRFRPLPGARPAIGKEGQIEEVEEELVEVLCHKDAVEKVVAEVKKVHPYEEPAIDIIPRLEVR